jgi:hypothetical protein
VLCIELRRNGKRLVVAGQPDKGVVTVYFVADNRGPVQLFRLVGVDASLAPGSHLEWPGGMVEVGDEFTLRFLEGESADPPVVEPPPPRTKAERRRRKVAWLGKLEKQVRDLRKELRPPRPRTKTRRIRRRS